MSQFKQTVKWGSSLVNPHVRWKEAAMLWHTNIFIIHTFGIVTCHWLMKTQAYEIRVDVVKLCILWVLCHLWLFPLRARPDCILSAYVCFIYSMNLSWFSDWNVFCLWKRQVFFLFFSFHVCLIWILKHPHSQFKVEEGVVGVCRAEWDLTGLLQVKHNKREAVVIFYSETEYLL